MSEVPAGTGSLSSKEMPLSFSGADERRSSPAAVKALHDKAVRFGNIEPVALTVISRGTLPLTAATSLALCLIVSGRSLSLQFWALALVTFLISSRIFSPLDIRKPASSAGRTRRAAPRVLLEWSCVAAILYFLSIAFNAHAIPRDVLLAWYAATPIAMLIVDNLSVPIAKWLAADQSATERYVIIGANEVGLELARRIDQSQVSGKFFGFLDYRSATRVPLPGEAHATANCRAEDFADYVRRNAVTRVYLALPLSTAPRIEALLKALRDTTASVYFVPNLFAFDLVQARCVEINGMPAFSICDSPLQGMSAFWKRAFDMAFALAVLLLFWPVFAAIAVAIKLSSPGPAIFKQRRYGLNGEQILVYKFRTMTVCEDGPIVAQASREDRRVTPIGGLLRRTSLDELPQVFNVLEGKMSFVGPRPHAVAHNEEYRKLICGYMIRHKMRPGITGWAQVNGLRGETATVDKMQRRLQYDLEYLNNWSFKMDLKIIARTALTVLGQRNAY
jgi:putative colanic acid biosysnthesis UDP-glucose lipid carrier transferase